MSQKNLLSESVTETISLFIQRGADPYLIGNSKLMSPLAIGVARKAYEIVKEIIISTPVKSDLLGEV